MDHIAVPKGGSHPSFLVPLFWQGTYTPDVDFSLRHFPNRHLQSAVQEVPRPCPDQVFISLVQGWLFFGVISNFFNEAIESASFCTTTESGSLTLCTRFLDTLRDSCISRMNLLDRNECRDACSWRINYLIQALHVCERIEEANIDMPGLHEVLTSVRILLCSLAITIRSVMTESPEVYHLMERLTLHPIKLTGSSWPDFVFLDHMLQNGWCPFQIEQLLRSCCATTMCHFASVVRRRRLVNHHACRTSSTCVARQLDPSSWSSHHVESDCSCDPIGIDNVKMMEIIEKGSIPLVTCSVSRADKVTLKLHQAMGREEYTAISHVWTDGLGNLRANELPRCQLRRLISRVRLLKPPEHRHKPITLWMDTFCIPIDPENIRNTAGHEAVVTGDVLAAHARSSRLKSEAIQMMSLIYAEAEHVLALDSELELLSYNEISLPELTALIHVCGWTGRAWTLQEGALASRLCFQFKNGFLFAKEGQRDLEQAVKIATWNCRWDEHAQLLQDCRPAWFLPSVGNHKPDARRSLSERVVQFQEVWNSLLYKTTTKPDDYFEIVANLLDYQSLEVRKLASPHVRMHSMLLSQSQLPLDVLCLPPESIPSPITVSTEYAGTLPVHPRDIRISTHGFTKYIRRVGDYFHLVADCGPTGYTFSTNHIPTSHFCISLSNSGEGRHFHPEVQLYNGSYPAPHGFKELYLYFMTVGGHAFIRDTKHYGAWFVVEKKTSSQLYVKYAGSLSFKSCFKTNCHVQPSSVVSATPVKNGTAIRVSFAESWYRPLYRRPVNAAIIRHRGSPATTMRFTLLYTVLMAFEFIVSGVEFVPLFLQSTGSLIGLCLLVVTAIAFFYYLFSIIVVRRALAKSYTNEWSSTLMYHFALQLHSLERNLRHAIQTTLSRATWFPHRLERWKRTSLTRKDYPTWDLLWLWLGPVSSKRIRHENPSERYSFRSPITAGNNRSGQTDIPTNFSPLERERAELVKSILSSISLFQVHTSVESFH